MVEHVALSRDRKFMIYDANTGKTVDDDDRRHLFRVPVDRAAPVALTSGETIEMAAGRGIRRSRGFVSTGARTRPNRRGRRRRLASRTLDAGACPRIFRLPNSSFPIRGVQCGRRHACARTVVSTFGTKAAPNRNHFRAWRPTAADAARLALHGLLQQCLCGESVSRSSRFRRAFGQLPARHRLWTKSSINPTARDRPVRPNIRTCSRARSSSNTRHGVDAQPYRHVGRFLWRLSHRPRAAAQLRHLQGGLSISTACMTGHGCSTNWAANR